MPKQADMIFTGLQPTGPLHIGNYLGTLRNCLDLQKKYRNHCYFMIADYHSITEDYDPKKKQQQIFELAVELLAVGLDPEQCVIYVQSDVPAVTELTWIFNTITSMSSLERMTQFKDKAGRQKKNINVGLFDYPVLQAADVLLSRANLVPVGQDQVQHVELMRDIARLYNRKFGETFPEPKPLLTKIPKVMSLKDPEKKMSKSIPGSFISLIDEPQVIKKKVMSAVTDVGPVDVKDRSAGVANLFMLLDQFGTIDDARNFDDAYGDGSIKYSELKEVIADSISDYFSDFRARRKELIANPKKVKQVLAEGASAMRKSADETMKIVRKQVGLSE